MAFSTQAEVQSIAQSTVRAFANAEGGFPTLTNGLIPVSKIPTGLLATAYAGPAILSTNPGTPTGKVFYTADQVGNYANFLDATATPINVAVNDGLVALSYDGAHWVKQTSPLNLAGFIKTADIVYSIPTQLFDKASYLANTFIGSGGGLVTEAGTATTNVIQIPSGQTSISYSNGNGGGGRLIAFYDVANAFLSQISYTATTGTFSIPIGAKSFQMCFARPITQTVIDQFMLNFGITPLAYNGNNTLYVGTINGREVEAANIKDGGRVNTVGGNVKSVINKEYYDANKPALLTNAFRTEDATFGSAGVNIFNKLVTEVGYIDPTNFSEQNFAPYLRSDFLGCSPSSAYTISGLSSVSYSRGVAFYDKDKIFISGLLASASVPSFTITTPVNTAFFKFTFKTGHASDTTDVNNVMVNAGTIAKTYEEFKQGIASIKGFLLLAANTVTPTVVTTSKKVLIFGDSITETLLADGTTARSNWPVFAAPLLGVSYSNYARSGASYKNDPAHTTPRQDMSIQISDAITAAETPDIVVIACGTNDGVPTVGASTTGDYATAMGKTTLSSLDKTLFWEALRWAYWNIRVSFPTAKCYSVLPIQRAGVDDPQIVFQPLYDAITKMAGRYGFTVIDATHESGIIKDTEIVGSAGTYLYDGLHPNTTGQVLMSKLIAKKILETYI
jgi:lysophospholipase L1-like esterase